LRISNEELVRINHVNQEAYLKMQVALREKDDILNEKDRTIVELKRALKDRNAALQDMA